MTAATFFLPQQRHPATDQQLLLRHLDIFLDHGGPLGVRDGELISVATGAPVRRDGGILDLYSGEPQDAGARVDATDSKAPQSPHADCGPDYKGIDSRQRLQATAKQDVLARLLDEQLPKGALVWDAGCGTAQLSNFLGLSWNRSVIAGDPHLPALRQGKEFADRNVIRNVAFVQMNLLHPPFRDGVFDVVIANLQHTADGERAFRSILSKLKPGGHILVRLFNSYGRLRVLWRRWLLAKFGGSAPCFDGGDSVAAGAGAFETGHSMDEVLRWFDRNGTDFVNCIPHADGSHLDGQERLFEAHDRASTLGRFGTQVDMLLRGSQDGGLFTMIGRRQASSGR